MTDLIFPNLSSVGATVLKAAQNMDATVLITGATGSGKSFLAEHIHKVDSRRSRKPLVKVNLATLSENLVESELFGHERGSFTGAEYRRVGKLESADGGMVFLDEIGELSVRLQSKLLDFIQYKKITPVGSNKEIHLNVRVVTATNRNLETAVKSGVFREDLYHRLNVFRVHLGDLAVMPQATLDLAQRFFSEKIHATGKTIFRISRELQAAIRAYPWPGNVRELQNSLEYAVAMERSSELSLRSMPSHFQQWVFSESSDVSVDRFSSEHASSSESILELPVSLNFRESKELFEKHYIEFILRACNGQINLTSRRTGLNKVSLSHKIKRYGIDWRKIRFDSLHFRT